MPKPFRRPSVGSREASLFTPPVSAQPLAARMRPRDLDEVVGQQHLISPGKPLRDAIEKGAIGSMVFWGPPGSGKTTIGRLIARYTDREFVPFSAVTEGVPRIREIIGAAEERLELGRQTILFVDEIHRFNKAQQDAFLPHVESGTIALIGATTENPSFEMNSALLSRMRVFVLEPISATDLRHLVIRALNDPERGLAGLGLEIDDDAIELIVVEADGDARRALTVLEAASIHAGKGGHVTAHVARDAMQKRFAHHDKSGETHFNMLSALHKSLRGSDPNGALYWMARMIEGGEDPMTIFRRSIAMAAEDIGLSDPNALQLAVAARDAYHMLGPPEGYLPLAEMIIYLATAPKSNSAYRALNAAMEAARESPAEPVPMHIRNAPTKLMKELGYHEGYQYAHEVPEAYIPQEYLPERLSGTEFYEPGPFGFEKEIAKRLAWWRKLSDATGSREGKEGAESSDPEADKERELRPENDAG
ncbi:MAG TPA: replication-associated recombination protein A [Gemmatimonadaceae bacterium]|nr:replication-associated recombination protein A [Gemmatimonadaceae bacterium]